MNNVKLGIDESYFIVQTFKAGESIRDTARLWGRSRFQVGECIRFWLRVEDRRWHWDSYDWVPEGSDPKRRPSHD